MMTLPGVPVIYYGDEVGLAGASDPDSRRVLPDVLGGALPPAQQALLDGVAAIGRARRCAPALRGTRTSLVADSRPRRRAPSIGRGRPRPGRALARRRPPPPSTRPAIPAGQLSRRALERDAHLGRHARRLHRAAARGRRLPTGGQPMLAMKDRRPTRSLGRGVLLALTVAAVAGGCGKGVTDPLPNPPSNPFNPGDPGSGGYGSGSGGGGAGMPVGPADVRHDAPSLRPRVRLRPDRRSTATRRRSRSSATTAPTRGPTATPPPSTAPSGWRPCPSRGRRR